MSTAARLATTLLAVIGLVLGTAVPVSAASAPATPAAAPAPAAAQAGQPVKTSLAGFAPGNIISDAVFTDNSTMTEAQIQAFFNSKVSSCRGGSDKYGPIICLKDFRMDTVNRPADTYCKGYTGASGESAARIIYRVSQACGINPQVLIVMLEKEQSLITHTWPSKWRYDAALGQGCPDTAACDPNYVGFFHQIYGAARQMQIYMEGRWFTYYAPGKTWDILFHPQRELINGKWVYVCGSAPVYIANKATAALYYYTPYQPNAAALRAGWGEGDSCSSYGNRNFYNLFTDWFGSTQTVANTPTQPRIASFDRDAYVIALDGSGAIWAYPFDGSTWGSRFQLAQVPGATRVISLGDLNGDGHRDLVVTVPGGALLLTGKGNGVFDSPESLGVNWDDAREVSAAGDFDGDGIPDIFTTDTAGRLLLWSGNEAGTLSAPRAVGTDWQTLSPLIGGADVTGDGSPDLYARTADGRVMLYAADGRGGWKSKQQVGVGFGAKTAIAQVGDVRGTGMSDLLARDASGEMQAFLGTGRGAIINGPRSGSGWGVMVSITGAGPVVTQPRPRKLYAGAGDVDHDGARDVIGVTKGGEVRLYRGSGTGGWRGWSSLMTGWSASDRLVTMGDFNRDAIADIARVRADGTFWLYVGDGRGGYREPKQIGEGWGVLDLLVGGIDFDGDGIADVLGRDSNGDMLLYRGDGRGGWVSGKTKVGTGWDIADAIFNAGDFDGDGHSDVLMRRTDGTLWLYPTTGAGGWGTPRQIGNGWDVMDLLIGPGDFTGDGKADVLARDLKGDLWLYRGDGHGGWGQKSRIGWEWNVFAAVG